MNTCYKFLVAFCIALLLGAIPQAQAQIDARGPSSDGSAFGVGDRTLAIGLGLGLTYDYISGTSIPPTFVAIYDQGYKDDVGPGVIGLGGILGYKSARYDYGKGGLDARWTNLLIGARGSYHLPLGEGLEKVDLYGGIMLGLRFSHYRNEYLALVGVDDDYSHVRLASGLAVGARYNITESVGAWVELGYDVALLKFGLHVNF